MLNLLFDYRNCTDSVFESVQLSDIATNDNQIPKITLEAIKKLGLERSESNLETLLKLFEADLEIELKREIVSSIGRQKNNDKIYEFLTKQAFSNHYMELVYQMFRTALYKANLDSRFRDLRDKMLVHYNNEVMQKMFEYYEFKQKRKTTKNEPKQIIKPSLLIGDNRITLNKIRDKQIHLIFTSPPYFS